MQAYLKTLLNDHLLRTSTTTKPSALYLCLFTVKPDVDGANGTEVDTTDTGYARISVGPLDANWSVPNASGVSQSLIAFTFGAPTADWGTVVAWGIADADTAGNLLIVEDLDTSVEVVSGSLTPMFPPGYLTITWS